MKTIVLLFLSIFSLHAMSGPTPTKLLPIFNMCEGLVNYVFNTNVPSGKKWNQSKIKDLVSLCKNYTSNEYQDSDIDVIQNYEDEVCIANMVRRLAIDDTNRGYDYNHSHSPLKHNPSNYNNKVSYYLELIGIEETDSSLFSVETAIADYFPKYEKSLDCLKKNVIAFALMSHHDNLLFVRRAFFMIYYYAIGWHNENILRQWNRKNRGLHNPNHKMRALMP